MSPVAVIITVLAYFAAVLLLSYFSGRKTDNAGFFSGNRNQSWYLVAFAMISASMSGVTFVSVPGMVSATAFGYMQMALGFIAGQIVIAYVLIPLYYKMNLVSIYEYLEERFGAASYKTGAWFFFISKILGAAVRLFLVCLSLQLLIFDPLHLSFTLNVLITIVVLLLYTFRGGVKSVIWIDTLKTVCMLASIVLCTVFIAKGLGLSFGGLFKEVFHNDMSRIFFFDDPNNPEYFFKQFFGGMFTVIAMTGMDQDMMQRSLTCKNYKDSQKNVLTSTVLQTIVIFLFLVLGELMYMFAAAHGITETGDKLFPAVATSGQLPLIVGVLFIVGVVACGFSAGGSALTALTTSFTVDILNAGHKGDAQVTSTRKWVHVIMAFSMGAVIIVFNLLNNTSAIDAVYKLASYTYGPLLGLFTFGIICKRKVREKWVPFVAILAPVLCLILQSNSARWFGGYKFSYELLIINALFTMLGLWILSSRSTPRAD